MLTIEEQEKQRREWFQALLVLEEGRKISELKPNEITCPKLMEIGGFGRSKASRILSDWEECGWATSKTQNGRKVFTLTDEAMALIETKSL